MSDEKQEKDITVIPGNVDDLDISPVYDHLEIEKPKQNKHKKQTIVVPEEINPKKN